MLAFMGGRNAPPKTVALCCAVFMDGKRLLFLARKNRDGVEEIGVPCLEVDAGEDQVASITAEFKRATGIDGHVTGTAFSGRCNCGSRKRRHVIPAIGFSMEAKNAKATPSPEFSGVKWLSYEDAKKFKVARRSLWLF